MRTHTRARLTLALFALIAATATARADDAPVPEQIVNVMNKIWGSHPGTRANHAKGVVAEASFQPAEGAARLSKASLFAGPAVPAIVRFSDSTGVPALPDGSPYANPHGLSVKFDLPGGPMDVVANSLKFFPVSTGEAFLALLTALSESGPDAPKPTKADQFIASHPTVLPAFASAATPASFARETYNGIDAFVFIDKAGNRQPFRLEFIPAAGAEHLSAEDAAKQSPDFLMTELPARLAKAPVVFSLVAHLANPGDPTKDPAQPWPADRKTVTLGTLTITKMVDKPDPSLLFLPGNLPDGIEPSDDPLIDTRVQAYAVSFGRRQ